MIVEYYEYKKTIYGYTLYNSEMTLVLNTSKLSRGADFYLKFVKPYEKFVSGMFYSKKYNLFKGRDLNNRTVKVKLLDGKAKIIIN